MGTNAEEDTSRWKHKSDGVFTVSRIYKMGLHELPGISIGPWKSVWKNMAPTKVKCFSWLVVRRACLTHEVLQKKGIYIKSRCSLCFEAAETNNHLFLHCKVTNQIWAFFINIAKERWTMPEHTADLLNCWIRKGVSKNQRKWWRTVPACIWWKIWKERNGRIFEGRCNSIQKIK